MTLTSKTRVAKRKLEIKEVRKEKQTTTSKKHDKKCFTKVDDTSQNNDAIDSAPKTSNKTKAELLEELYLLKELNEALLEEVKSNEENIANLEKKEKKYVEAIRALEDEIKQKPLELLTKGCQTDDNAVPLFCEECDYPSETLYDLGEHMGEFHSGLRIPCNICSDILSSNQSLEEHEAEIHNRGQFASVDTQVDYESSDERDMGIFTLYFNFFEETFVNKKDLMKHKKIKHAEKVSICWKYATNTCEYGDKNCWFSHTMSQNDLESVNFKCNSCEIGFNFQAELLRHKKQEHTNLVAFCTNSKNGTYKFRALKCLFVHEKN